MKKRTLLGSLLSGLLLGALSVLPAAAQSFSGAELYQSAGTKTEKTKGSVNLDSQAKALRFVAGKGQVLADVPYGSIQKISYEKSAKPRYAAAVIVSPLFLFSKSKRHWMTVEYTVGAEKKTALIRLDKSNYEAALKAVESQTGVKVQYPATPD